MKNLKRSVCACLTIMVIAALCLPSISHSAERDKDFDYVFGLHFASTGGKGSSQYYKLVAKLLEIVEQEYGYKIKLGRYESEQAVIDAFKNGEIDMAKVFYEGYREIEDAGGEMYPWGTYTVDKRKKNSMCFWKKRGDEVLDAQSLPGKVLVGNEYGYMSYIVMRHHLLNNGIDEPLWKVFGGFISVPGANSAYMALASGKGDVILAGYDQKYLLKVFFPQIYAKLEPDFCTEEAFGRGMLVINKKTVTQDKIEFADEVLLTMSKDLSNLGKKYPDARFINEFLKMSEMRPAHATLNDYDYSRGLEKRAQENGWMEEAHFFMDKFNNAERGKVFQIKPDMTWCKKTCPSNDSECVLSCLE